EMYFWFKATISWVSHSKEEPRLHSIYLLKCLLVDLLVPSAMLEGIETAQRISWETRLNFSTSGNPFVILYVSSTKIIPSCQILSFLKLCLPMSRFLSLDSNF